jgi:hypothetical protein
MNTEKILPILKPSIYKKDNELFIKEPLFTYEDSPVVAYGEDQGGSIRYEYSKNIEEFESRLNSLREIALKNIESIKVQYSIQMVDNEKFLVVHPHEYACEKILDKKFISEISNAIGSKSLLIAIPHQGIFYAVDFNGTLKYKLAGLSKQKFENPQAPAITPYLFQILNGEIISIFGEGIKNYSSILITKDLTGNYLIKMNNSSLEDFQSSLNNGYTTTMLKAMIDKEFSGKILFIQENLEFRFTDEAISICNGFVERVEQNELAQAMLNAFNGKKLEIEIYQFDNLILPKK